MNINTFSKKIGILGGGQLGKMLYQAGSILGLNIQILEKDTSFPAATVCPYFTCGDITNFDDVMAFAQDLDVITIEIENVNIEALEALEAMGKEVYPQPAALKIIKDKGLQKQFYKQYDIPTAPFFIVQNKEEIHVQYEAGNLKIPFVQKSRTDGYDGKGVHIVRSVADLQHLLEGPSLVEEMVDIYKEIAVIVARNPDGEVKTFPPVEMQFHPTANLVEFLFCPSDITPQQSLDASMLAIQVADRLQITGLLAVELFIDAAGNILVNEVAPRPHNSGHHTIEACVTSQYTMHLRALLNLSLSSTELIRPAVMVNVLGEEGYSGPAYYEGLETCLGIDGVYPHLYGKKETKPFRKMGHVTVVNTSLEKAIEKATTIQKTLKVISQ